jgi:hypothetical protein
LERAFTDTAMSWESMTVLILLRHGQTPNNAESRLQGSQASPLSGGRALGGQASMILNLWVNLATVSVLGEVHGEFILSEYNIGVQDL